MRIQANLVAFRIRYTLNFRAVLLFVTPLKSGVNSAFHWKEKKKRASIQWKPSSFLATYSS